MVLRMTRYRPKARKGATIRNINAIFPPMTKAMTKANSSMSGQRIAVRMIIIYAFCTLVTSVVSRVTREEVEK